MKRQALFSIRRMGEHAFGILLGLGLWLIAGSNASAQVCSLDLATDTTIDAQPLLKTGYGVRWNRATNRVAFMQPDASGYYRIYTMNPDGSDQVEFAPPGLPPGHRGSVYWTPDGRYLLFIAQKSDWPDTKLFGVPSYGALPGWGTHDDIWIASADAKAAWRLTDDPNTKREGELLPVISPDGRYVAWGKRQEDKSYILKVADLSETPEPHLSNVRSYQPGAGKYFEPGGFSSDSQSLVYTTDDGTHSFWQSQIYSLNLATGATTRLTQGKDYNEHPNVVKTPTGDWIIYMSTKGSQRFRGHLTLGTDWWAMRIDGSNAKRLTFMNSKADANPEYFGGPMVAGTVSIGPSGDYFFGDMQDSLVKQTGLVRIFRFTCATH
jgi:Tol biopolymer transport system component